MKLVNETYVVSRETISAVLNALLNENAVYESADELIAALNSREALEAEIRKQQPIQDEEA